MSERADDDLLQRALDGAVDDTEAARLQERLKTDPAMRARAGQLRRLAEVLADQEREDPPPAFTDNVMEAIAARASVPRGSRLLFGLLPRASARRHGSELPWSTGWAGAIAARSALWAVAGLALVVVLAVVYYNGARSVNGGAQGTIGAANRDRGTQPPGRDVAAGPAAAQQFLHSDLFDRLAKDRNARDLLADDYASQLLSAAPPEALRDIEAWGLWKRVRAAVPGDTAAQTSRGVRTALAALRSAEATSLLQRHAAFLDAFDSPEFAALARNTLFMTALGENEPLMGEALKAVNLQAALKSHEALKAALRSHE